MMGLPIKDSDGVVLGNSHLGLGTFRWNARPERCSQNINISFYVFWYDS